MLPAQGLCRRLCACSGCYFFILSCLPQQIKSQASTQPQTSSTTKTTPHSVQTYLLPFLIPAFFALPFLTVFLAAMTFPPFQNFYNDIWFECADVQKQSISFVNILYIL